MTENTDKTSYTHTNCCLCTEALLYSPSYSYFMFVCFYSRIPTKFQPTVYV